jgi:5-(carboxyamino)imidazole ribonucleotide synthase
MVRSAERKVNPAAIPTVLPTVIPPGGTLGVMGGGQLGAMFAMAAKRMGYRVEAFSDVADCPAAHHVDRVHVGAYDDPAALLAMARGIDVLTFEFENVPAAPLEALIGLVPVRPAPEVLFITQDRGREKAFLVREGFACAPHRLVRSKGELHAAVSALGLPAVLKTAAFGYDGKGQRKLDADAGPRDIDAAWDALAAGHGGDAPASGHGWDAPAAGRGEDARPVDNGDARTVNEKCVLLLEGWIDFECEISVVAARGLDGSTAVFAPTRNHHSHHILDISSTPAGLPNAVLDTAREMAAVVLEKLDVVGVACVEFFVTRDGRVLVNEIAPRPHNSGHLTIQACETSQFEQQVRAICGLPLGSTTQRAPAAMANLLGDCWNNGVPDWTAALAVPGVSLLLYGKREPRPGRKMGHLTALADTVETAVANVARARSLACRRA